jgi:hypothetical protein
MFILRSRCYDCMAVVQNRMNSRPGPAILQMKFISELIPFPAAGIEATGKLT